MIYVARQIIVQQIYEDFIIFLNLTYYTLVIYSTLYTLVIYRTLVLLVIYSTLTGVNTAIAAIKVDIWPRV